MLYIYRELCVLYMYTNLYIYIYIYVIYYIYIYIYYKSSLHEHCHSVFGDSLSFTKKAKIKRSVDQKIRILPVLPVHHPRPQISPKPLRSNDEIAGSIGIHV